MHVRGTYSILILAGGKSSRMGYPKPWIRIAGEVTFLEHIVNQYHRIGFNDIVIVLNQHFCSDVWSEQIARINSQARIVPNFSPDKGRLYSIFLGLNEVRQDNVFIHNVDNPFVKSCVLEAILDEDSPNPALPQSIRSGGQSVSLPLVRRFRGGQIPSVIIPSFNGKGGHPVLIHQNVINEILHHHKEYETLKEVFQNFKKKYVEVHSSSILSNMNSPADLKAIT